MATTKTNLPTDLGHSNLLELSANPRQRGIVVILDTQAINGMTQLNQFFRDGDGKASPAGNESDSLTHNAIHL